MNSASPYGWLFFAALGLGLLLSSLVRKGRNRMWLAAGFTLFIIALGGAFIFTDFIVPGFVRNRVLPFYLPLTVFFFLASWRLAVLVPFMFFLASLIPIVWGTSGAYSLERGIYPVKITCYPPTAEGRSYNVVYADGRESSLTGCGDYLAIERIAWDWRLFFISSREYPVGFIPYSPEGTDVVSNLSPVPLTLEQPRLAERPGMIREMRLVGPVREDLFYTWWLTRNGQGELILTSLNPEALH